MISVQGPHALQAVSPLFRTPLDQLRYYRGLVTDQFGRPCTVSRTGYTGEDGFELIVRAEDAVDVWKNLFRSGRDLGISAVGLGARDTLRLEAAMPLYGHELSEQWTPVQAGLGFAIDTDDREFIGREALLAAAADADLETRVGLALSDKRVPRDGYPVLAGESRIGRITSGTFSPTLGKPIAMAYVAPAFSKPGTSLEVDIRGRPVPATVVDLPFYRRHK
jgi:aminomethyltransferase